MSEPTPGGGTADAVATAAAPFNTSGITSINAEFPAETDPYYVWSEYPQNSGEQWLYDHFPDLWAQGVRAVSAKYMGDHPGATVQFIDGEKYVGSDSVPLGFREETTDPNSIASDNVGNIVEQLKDLDTWVEGNTGQGGYSVRLTENAFKPGSGCDVYIEAYGSGRAPVATFHFATWEEAWAHFQSAGFTVDGRQLYPGEVSSVVVIAAGKDASGRNAADALVWDSASGSWVTAVKNTA